MTIATIIFGPISMKKPQNVRLEWIPGTAYIIERFFSQAKQVSDDKRNSILPVSFESQMFLKINRKSWDLETINMLLN